MTDQKPKTRRPSTGGSFTTTPKGELKQLDAPTKPNPGKAVIAQEEADAAAAEASKAQGDRKAASAPAPGKGSTK